MKGRPADHPVIVHVARAAQLDELARDVPDVAHALADAFWPGPLTLVVRARPDARRGGGDGWARHGRHPRARSSGRARAARRVRRRSRGAVGEPLRPREPDDRAARARRPRRRRRRRARRRSVHASASSRRSSTSPAPSRSILRVGGVERGATRGDRRRAARACGPSGEIAAPGTLASHYAPRRGAVVELGRRADASSSRPARVGLLASAGGRRVPACSSCSTADVERVRARAVRTAARGSTSAGVDVILAVVPADADGIGAAVADRLRRAARSAAGSVASATVADDARRRARSASSTAASAASPSCGRCSISCPARDVVYFGDTGRFPYGPEARRRGLEVLARDRRPAARARRARWSSSRATAPSAAALDHLRERLDVPVVGVIEPGLRAARRGDPTPVGSV